MIENLPAPTPHQLDALTALWERSVRATHGFLAAEDIGFFRRIVRGGALTAVELLVVRNAAGEFTAFAGVAGESLEMLFVDPAERGKGIGRRLVSHVVRHCGIRRVDANEQNTLAVGFYKHMGFRIVGRDALDPSGKPYPILHLEL